jgi:hypothetical protein
LENHDIARNLESRVGVTELGSGNSVSEFADGLVYTSRRVDSVPEQRAIGIYVGIGAYPSETPEFASNSVEAICVLFKRYFLGLRITSSDKPPMSTWAIRKSPRAIEGRGGGLPLGDN